MADEGPTDEAAVEGGSVGDGSRAGDRDVVDDTVALIDQALAGDRRAGRRLSGRLLPVIRARVVRLLRRGGAVAPDRVDDLMQAVWLALCEDGGRRLRGWRPGGGMKVENYVGLIAERVALNTLEREQAQKRGGGRTHASLDAVAGRRSGDDPAGEAALSRRLARLCECLRARLSARDLSIAQMLHVDGIRPIDVARSFGVRRNAVDKANHRVRLAVTACLGADSPGPSGSSAKSVG